MPTMADWVQRKVCCLSELNDIESKKHALAEIKIKLTSLNDVECQQISSSLDLKWLFSQLDTIDREYTQQICDICKVLFNALDPGEVHLRYSTDISLLLSHSNALVRTLVLEELLRTASNSEKLQLLLADTSLLVCTVDKIADENLTVAKVAMAVIKKIGEDTNGLNHLYAGELLRVIARMLVKNDIVSFRVYEVVGDIAQSSTEGLYASIKSGFLNSLINVLDNDDILLQLNSLEVMTQLALTEEGLAYLEEQDVLRKLVKKIAEANENPLSNLLIPGLMKFFGNVAQHWPNEVFSKYPIVVSALFDVIDSGDQCILGAALDTLGHVAASVEGKYALQGLGDYMPCALKKVAEIIQQMPTAIRIRGLNNLAVILEVKAHEQDNRILSLTKSWFDSLCDDSLGLIVTFCKQPFADIRQSSLEVLAIVANQAWGQEYISVYPGLVEFLLDRNIETFKECKEAKYKVVKCLSQAEQDIFDANTMQRFKEFVNEGPLFVETNTEVAIEGGV